MKLKVTYDKNGEIKIKTIYDKRKTLGMKLKTVYDNEAYKFINSLDKEKTIVEIAEILGVTYSCLYKIYKNNKISYNVKERILKNFKLNQTQQRMLKNLVFGIEVKNDR